MVASFSLRRSLRKIPAFHSLASDVLDKLLGETTLKEYKEGDILWKAEKQPDFLGIIQSGEVIVEHLYKGRTIRSVRLGPGDYIQPRNAAGGHQHNSICIRALTDVNLHILKLGHLDNLQISWDKSKTLSQIRSVPNKNHTLLRRVWSFAVLLLILVLTWQDLVRIASGALFLVGNKTERATYDEQDSIRLLRYATVIDRNAVFAFNQEGYLWFQREDLQIANSFFDKAVVIDRKNGSSLNNLAVTQFMTGNLDQAVELQKDAARYDSDRSIVQYNLGLILLNQNDFTGAIHAFREASYINPGWALPYIQSGFAYLQSQNDIQAEQEARSAIEADPTQQSAHLILAIALYNQEKNQEALEAVNNALSINPDDRVAQFYKALLLERSENFEASLAILQQLFNSSYDRQELSRTFAEIELLHRIMPVTTSEEE